MSNTPSVPDISSETVMPNTPSDAVSDPKWVEAMEKELKTLEINNTWQLTELPEGHKAISSKWVYKIKYFPNGKVERYKARLVIRGFDQKEGVDYKHTFSPVAKTATEIYMKPPEGYTKASQGQSKHDYSLFVKAQGDLFTVALVYVDDILITWNSDKDITDTKLALDSKFTIKDLGLARYFLGIELCTTNNGTYLHQRKYVLDLLKDAGLTTAKPTPFPLPQNMKLSLDKGAPISDPESYRGLVRRLLYLSMTRPDISYDVQHLSQLVSSPKEPRLQATTHLLRYLKGSINKGLYYHVQSNLRVAGFLDADWASCLMTRKSLTGYCIFLGHSLVS
uniref:Reverse transcriptase Ty1/copia-type domain-containing protein n=1 Tax=Tanacetum cinerariifolium TaxID=118510 RepID=A0A6L2KSP9_TANCI|nr:hypothetical protein [Tanacetum cinerariifolium]